MRCGNRFCRFLQTVLHWAAKHGNEDIVKLFAGTYRANVNAKTVSFVRSFVVTKLTPFSFYVLPHLWKFGEISERGKSMEIFVLRVYVRIQFNCNNSIWQLSERFTRKSGRHAKWKRRQCFWLMQTVFYKSLFLLFCHVIVVFDMPIIYCKPMLSSKI